MALSSGASLVSSAAASFLLILLFHALGADARVGPSLREPLSRRGRSFSVSPVGKLGMRKLSFLVEEQPLILEYHNGPILSAAASITVYAIWYGSFSDSQKDIVRDFVASFSSDAATHPTVSSWWGLTKGYKDATGSPVQGKVQLAGEVSNDYKRGKSLANSDLEALVIDSLSTFPRDPSGVYLVFTAADVSVEGFCMNSCASHFATAPSKATRGMQLPYGWVGNAATQCPGMCAWPFAKAQYGPNKEPLVSPNADVGMDGVIINLGTVLAGTATNPFNNGFYQGDASTPLEAASACAAIYGEGAFSGEPGNLLVDPITGASYNVGGVNGRKYLLPAMWNPSTLKCSPPS